MARAENRLIALLPRPDRAPFRRELSSSKSLQLSLHRYVYVLMAQLATSAACTRFHNVEPRLARRLLTTQDRMCSNTVAHMT